MDIVQQREEWDRKRKIKVKGECRWRRNTWGGVSIGSLDPGPNGGTYDDFDTRILKLRNIFSMTAKEGRKKSIHDLVVVGNRNGTEGFVIGKAAFRKAKSRVIHYLNYIENEAIQYIP